MVRSRRRCALRGRCSCSAADAAGGTACRRSQRCTHAQAPFRKLRRALRESIDIGCGNRADSRLGRGSTALVPDAQWGGACVESPAWSSSGQWIGARSSARPGRTLRQGNGGCGGTAHFHSPQWSQPDIGRSSRRSVVDRSWCTVGPLVGFAFGLVSDLSDLIRGSDGALTHT
jgi:hypothetical protein